MSEAAVDPRPLLAAATGRLHTLGLRPGDRVATVLGNDPGAFALGWACALAGVVQVPVPADLPAPAAAEVLLDADPALLLSAVAAPALDAAHAQGLAVHGVEGAAVPRDPDAAAPRTRAMAYTSGTTGRRKGVHVGLHGAAWGRAVLDDERATFGDRHGDTHLVVSPLYHSGPARHALVCADGGGRVAVLPRFDVASWRTALRRVRPTSMFCVPTQLHRLLSDPAFVPDDLASLTLLVHAGAPCPAPLKQRLLAVAPAGAVWEFYGSTEAQFSVCPPEAAAAAPGSVGTARPGRSLTVRDADGGEVPQGDVGTVWTTAPWHARWSYWRAPGRTAEAWAGDGDGDAAERCTVGDLGRLDVQGRLTLAGRPGDLVVTGGVNVYPAEVERALLALPGVGEAVAFGQPDAQWGERLVAAVTPARDASPDAEVLLAALRERLPAARVPKLLRVVEDLPRTATGKVRRADLSGLLDGT